MKQISMYGHVFEISAPYAEGHTLTAAEARALNQLRAENISNNVRKQVKEADALENEKEKAKALEAIRTKISEYDANYVFSFSTGVGRSTDPVMTEARKIARAALSAALAKQEKKLKDYREEIGEDALKAKIDEIAAMDKVVAKARENVKENERRAKEAAAIGTNIA